MDAGAYDAAAGGQGPQRGGHELAGRGEDDRGVELLAGAVDRFRRPRRHRAPGEGLAALVACAREREHLTALVDGDLADHVGGGAKPIQARGAAASPAQPQGAVADQATAQQRRSLVSVSAAGSARQKRSSATASSAKPPSRSRPVKRAYGQRFSRPLRQ